MLKIYRPLRERNALVRFAGPGDLAGYCGPIVVEGSPEPEEASLWAIPLGLAVTRGATVTRRAS